jgi:hypothetical protein
MAIDRSINYLGKPYEGKPHVRFDEGSRETGSRVSTAPLSYSTNVHFLTSDIMKGKY